MVSTSQTYFSIRFFAITQIIFCKDMKKICQIKAQVGIIFAEKRKKVKKFARDNRVCLFLHEISEVKNEEHISFVILFRFIDVCINHFLSERKGREHTGNG